MKEWILKVALDLIAGFINEDMIKSLKASLINYLRELAKKTENQLDDKIVDMIADAFDVEDQ